MKPFFTTLYLSAFFCVTSYGQDLQNEKESNKPKATYQVGAARVIVWENKSKSGDSTTWKNFKVEKWYKKGDEWKSTTYFNDRELLELRAALDKAILEESIKVYTTKD